MAEGVTVAQEAFRLGMIGDDGPGVFGNRPDDTAAAFYVGLFVRWLADFDVHPVDEEGEPFIDDEMTEWEDLFAEAETEIAPVYGAEMPTIDAETYRAVWLSSCIGATEVQVENAVGAVGEVRVTKRNGVLLIGDRLFKPNRVNIEIEDGKVVRATFG